MSGMKTMQMGHELKPPPHDSGFAKRGKTILCAALWTPFKTRLCMLQINKEEAFFNIFAFDIELVFGDFKPKVWKKNFSFYALNTFNNITTPGGIQMVNNPMAYISAFKAGILDASIFIINVRWVPFRGLHFIKCKYHQQSFGQSSFE